MAEHYDLICKIVLVGESSVGKTGLIRRFTRDVFNTQTNTTIGIELAHKTVEIRGKTIKAQLWDTGGQEKFRCITAPFYRGALGGIIVYDVTNRQTFQSIDYWVEQIRDKAMQGVAMLLIGNKSDMWEDRQVTEEEGRKLAETLKMPWLETSAKNGDNVQEAFQTLMETVSAVNLLNTSTSSMKLDRSFASIRQAKRKRKYWC
jgi:small GTP-binding protein